MNPKVKLIISLFVGGLGGLLIMIGAITLYASVYVRSEYYITSGFERETGIVVTNQMEVINCDETHDQFFLGDGEIFLILKMTEDAFNKVLKSPACFGQKEWKPGPVLAEDLKSLQLLEDQSIVHVFDSKDLVYANRLRGPQDMPRHNGDIVVLDKDMKRVYYIVWDF